MSLTKENLLEYFRDQLNVDVSQIDDETPLFSSGLVDSFAIVELIMHLGQFTGVPLGPEDIDLENLDTLNRIMAYVAAKAAE